MKDLQQPLIDRELIQEEVKAYELRNKNLVDIDNTDTD